MATTAQGFLTGSERHDDPAAAGGVLHKLSDTIAQAERYPPPISCPPPFRGRGLRMA